MANVVEVIAYEPTFDKEAPRIYLDNDVLYEKIDKSKLESKLSTLKEPFLRQREVPDTPQLELHVIKRAKADYLLDRLFITEFSPDKKEIVLEVRWKSAAHTDQPPSKTGHGKILVCTKPVNLVTFQPSHIQAPM